MFMGLLGDKIAALVPEPYAHRTDVGHYFEYSLHEFALLSRRRSRKGGGEEKHGEATGFPADNGRQLGPL